MFPIEEFEEDLAEIKNYQPYARRIFWTGANPFAMSYDNLKHRALTIRDSLTLFPDTELYKMAQQGLFIPAGEKGRIRELQILVNNLNIRPTFWQTPFRTLRR